MNKLEVTFTSTYSFPISAFLLSATLFCTYVKMVGTTVCSTGKCFMLQAVPRVKTELELSWDFDQINNLAIDHEAVAIKQINSEKLCLQSLLLLLLHRFVFAKLYRGIAPQFIAIKFSANLNKLSTRFTHSPGCKYVTLSFFNCLL